MSAHTETPAEGWKHATNAAQFMSGSRVFGWYEGGKLWSGIVVEADVSALRVRVKNILPGVLA